MGNRSKLRAAVLIVDFSTDECSAEWISGKGCLTKALVRADELRRTEAPAWVGVQVLVGATEEARDEHQQAVIDAGDQPAAPADRKALAAQRALSGEE